MSAPVRIGRASDVPAFEGRRVTVDGRRIAVFRLRDRFAAIDAECPHKGGPLSDGLVAEGCVTCPLHGWRFDLETGRALAGEGAVTVHDVVERGGELWLTLSDDACHRAA
jgi:nitrite reductase (NADH) small subunit